jgi:1-acyl-sn-glycerol-3-phosphate acyltransferase
MSLLTHIVRLVRLALALLWTGVFASVAIVATTFGIWAGDHVMPRVWVRGLFWLYRLDVRVRGLERIDPLRPYVFVANHRSALDPLVVIHATRRMPRFVAAVELNRYPIFGLAFRKLGHVFIDRSDPHSAYAALRIAAARIGQRHSVFFAPEGGRRRADANEGDRPGLGAFKDGAFRYAQWVDVPVVPIALIGTGALWPPRTLVPNPGCVWIEFGPPLQSRGVDVSALKDKARGWIEKTLAADCLPQTHESATG